MFATPFAVEALDIRLTGACGFALFPSSAAEPDALVRLADAALYRAKAVGPGGVVVFDARAESKAVESGAMAKLRLAVVQPIAPIKAAGERPSHRRDARGIRNAPDPRRG